MSCLHCLPAPGTKATFLSMLKPRKGLTRHLLPALNAVLGQEELRGTVRDFLWSPQNPMQEREGISWGSDAGSCCFSGRISVLGGAESMNMERDGDRGWKTQPKAFARESCFF